MALVTEWPKEIVPSSMSWYLVSNSKTFISTFNGSSQTVRFPGSRWCCTLTFNNMVEKLSRQLEALTAELDGESGRVKIRNWIRKGLPDIGEPIVSVASQTGRILQTKGWKTNLVVLRKGDYLTVNNELKMITIDVKSDASGNASIPISPALRYSPQVNEKIETLSPFGIFKLTSNDQGKFNFRPGVFTNVTLEFEEALY
ncbi:hypothetical protein QE177_08305 [Arsenophonus sp. aPb]|uniref:hypothetical protein n=1 Tax=Arsenophonus sp. aPb TaxID=3041619 RepID=UPI0024688A79|nr:hypothetical protein [Arsenophonus sp. aPb]WGL97233.1 hypothetical protein QE177_08305 [Arsenophonus sp. aPb]